jgi:hypothetical protein
MKPPMRFSRHDGIYRSDVINKTCENWGRGTASRWSAPGPAKGHGGRSAPYSSSTMSSGRLFLDRVARQHGPSPLHRQTHPKTVPGWSTMNLQRTANSVLTVCLSQGDNRSAHLSRRVRHGRTGSRPSRPSAGAGPADAAPADPTAHRRGVRRVRVRVVATVTAVAAIAATACRAGRCSAR